MEYCEPLEDMDCAICMEAMEVDQTIIRTTNCEIEGVDKNNTHDLKGHKFHENCLVSWLKKAEESNRTEASIQCPLCRAQLIKSTQSVSAQR